MLQQARLEAKLEARMAADGVKLGGSKSAASSEETVAAKAMAKRREKRRAEQSNLEVRGSSNKVTRRSREDDVDSWWVSWTIIVLMYL